MIETATIRTAGEFAGLADEWDGLVLAQRRPSPYLLHAWLAPWIETFGDTGEIAVHVARRDDRLVAALPLVVTRRHGVRTATFLGRGQSALADLLLAPGEDDAAARAVLRQSEDDGFDLVDLFGLPVDSTLARIAPAGRLSTVVRVEAPVLDVADGWEHAYAAKTSARRRSLHRRRRRQLAELGKLTVEHATHVEELEPALEEAFRLHRLRWEGRPDGSGFASERGAAFQRAALHGVAALGVPRIVSLKLDGRTIAFHYYFLLERTMLVHRLAFDPAYARFSPGLIATLDAVEAAAADGATRVEFLGGDERYKLELCDWFEPLVQALGLTGSLRGRAAVGARLGAIAARRRLKRSPALRRLYVDGLAPLRRRSTRGLTPDGSNAAG